MHYTCTLILIYWNVQCVLSKVVVQDCNAGISHGCSFLLICESCLAYELGRHEVGFTRDSKVGCQTTSMNFNFLYLQIARITMESILQLIVDMELPLVADKATLGRGNCCFHALIQQGRQPNVDLGCKTHLELRQ